MSHFVEYNDYANTRNKFSTFYESFIDKSRNANTIIPFLKDSFQHVEPSDKKDSNHLNLLTINNFSRLQAEALRCKIFNTDILRTKYVSNAIGAQRTGPINSNNRTIGLINFTQGNDVIVSGTDSKSQFTNTATNANTYVIRKSQPRVDLLFSTLVIIEIFIDILEAYKSFIDLNTNNDINIIDNILIVSKNSRQEAYNNKNHGFFLKTKTGTSLIANYTYPSKSALILSIKSFDHINSLNTKIFDENISLHATQASSGDSTNIFHSDKESIFAGSKINAVNIQKNGTNTSYNGVEQTAIPPLTPQMLAQRYSSHASLLGEILKYFINYIFLIKKDNRNIQINALLNYYKIIKCYLLKSVTVGNLLFNTLYNNSQGKTSISSSYMISEHPTINGNGNVAIDPIIIDSTTTSTNIIISAPTGTPTQAENYWKKITHKNIIINKKIEDLKTEIKLSIKNNDVPNVSEQKPILFQGFLAAKIDEKTIRISFIDTTVSTNGNTMLAAFNLKTKDFPGHSTYVPIQSVENIFNSRDLNNGEYYLNEILHQSSPEKKISDIKKQYQLEINNVSYKIFDVAIVTVQPTNNAGNTYNKISYIDIIARFDTQNNTDNDIDFFNLERNTYDIFETSNPYTAVTDIKTIVEDNGKIKSSSSLNDKTIILYNFTNIHPNNINNVIMNKSVDHAFERANNIKDLREVNKKILLNEMKINNSGRLYEIQDNKYNVLNNSLMVYYVIVAIIIAIIVIINVSNMEKPLIKTVTTGCFSVIVLLFISYYMVNIIYVEGFSNMEHFNSSVEPFVYTNGADEFAKVSDKVRVIQATMTSLEFDISRLFDILTVSIPQTNFTNTNNTLNNILESEKNDKIYVNDNLKHSNINAYNHIDVKKYEIMNINILIKAFLYTSFVIIGLYTLQLYIDTKYLDILIFISAILLIIIFTYYIVYSNVIVRTISKNKYWGKENEDSYK